MTLDERIVKRLVEYYLSGRRRTALELSLLYWRRAHGSVDEEKGLAACVEGLYWLKNAGYPIFMDLEEPDIQSLKETLRRGLVYYLRKLAKRV